MSQFAHLLRNAAGEVRDYCRTSPDAQTIGVEWLESLARRLEAASSLEREADVEREIGALAFAITDSGPLTEQLSPSLTQALDPLQRLRKRRARP